MRTKATAAVAAIDTTHSTYASSSAVLQLIFSTYAKSSSNKTRRNKKKDSKSRVIQVHFTSLRVSATVLILKNLTQLNRIPPPSNLKVALRINHAQFKVGYVLPVW